MRTISIWHCVIALCLSINLSTYAQLNYSNGLPTVLPSSPSASEFLKYGEIPISKYTGMPNISIPLYTINARGLDVPISLSYHSNGIKVAEEASWVGLGWSLMDGGSIVQVISGLDDFGLYKNRTLLDIDTIADYASGGSAPGGILDNCTGTQIDLSKNIFPNIPGDQTSVGGTNCFITSPQYSLPTDFILGTKDYQPDVFKFNALGYSGEFIMDWETETFKCLTDPTVKIQAYPSIGNGFMIHFPDGHKFVFQTIEETTFDVNFPEASGLNLASNAEAASRIYKLTDIYTVQNENIHFNYTISSIVTNFPTITKTDTRYRSTTYGFHPALNVPRQSTAASVTKQQIAYLSSIEFDQGALVFVTSDRIDLENSKKLDRIELRRNSPTGPVVTQFDFDYDYFIGNTAISGPDISSTLSSTAFPTIIAAYNAKTSSEHTHRLRLLSVKKSGDNPYEFQYNNQPLPKKTSMATDYWGNFNGYSGNQTIYANVYRFNLEAGNSAYAAHQNNNKSPRESMAKAAILERITYPTKGYTEFDYELNSFDNQPVPEYFNSSTNTSGPYFGAGLRIKSISSFDDDGTMLLTKRYEYTDGRLMTPLLFLNYADITYHGDYWPSGGGTDSYTVYTGQGYRITLSSSNHIRASLNGNGNYVGYSEVTEILESTDGALEDKGKIVDRFINDPFDGGFGDSWDVGAATNGTLRELSMPLFEKKQVPNGSMIEQLIYNREGALLKKTENTFSWYLLECGNGMVLGPVSRNTQCIIDVPSSFESTHKLGVYPIRRINAVLNSTTVTDYQQDGQVQKTDYFGYNNYYQVNEQTTFASNGDTLTTKIYRPYDYNEITHISFGMKINHVLNPVLRKEFLINGQILNTERFDHKIIWSDSYNIPSTIYAQEKYLYGKYIISETDLEEVITYNKYDNFGNLLEVTRKDGQPLSYIWGYNHRYPVAKIENMAYDDIPIALINDIHNATLSTNHFIQTAALDDLRNDPAIFNAKALVTTYTYVPLVGVSSVTDPKGYRLFYQYDANNRLKYVREGSEYGPIISETEINFKN